jgi:EAL domain-containing protein (putative c-di-GMP-specific phosphodiesterase class I)
MLAAQLENNLCEDLVGALGRQEFSLHYQPQVDIRSGLIIGGEALVRWTHPTLGMISPGQFIPMAEESGLMPPLGDWILHAACEQIRSCSVTTHIPLRVAVNLSPLQLDNSFFVQKIMNTFWRTSLQPEQLELEIPEQSFLALTKPQLAVLSELHAFGIGLVLEDVGRMSAELPHFKQVKFDKIKIDPILVRQAHADTAAQTRICSVVASARASNVKILAEGIETQEQFDWICMQNPDEAQGYFFGRPQPADNICAEYRSAVESVPITKQNLLS